MAEAGNPQEGTPQVAIKGMRQAEWERWLHHPVTELFRQYLSDYQARLTEEAVNKWLAIDDPFTFAEDRQMRYRVAQIVEIVDLRFQHIADFYRGTEHHAAATDQDQD